MTKSELIDALRKETGLSITKSEQVVELFFDRMSDALANSGRVEIRSFCSIFVKQYKGYTGRNPKTGKPVKVNAKNLPFFKSGLDLKQRVDYSQTQVRGGKRK